MSQWIREFWCSLCPFVHSKHQYSETVWHKAFVYRRIICLIFSRLGYILSLIWNCLVIGLWPFRLVLLQWHLVNATSLSQFILKLSYLVGLFAVMCSWLHYIIILISLFYYDFNHNLTVLPWHFVTNNLISHLFSVGDTLLNDRVIIFHKQIYDLYGW